MLTLNSNAPVAFSKKVPVALKRAGVISLLLILFLAEFFRVYFIMPFPGSQQNKTVDFAYWISMHIGWIRLLAVLAICIALGAVWNISAVNYYAEWLLRAG